MNQLLQIYHSETLCLVCPGGNPTYFAERHQYYHLEVYPGPIFSEKFFSVFQEYYYLFLKCFCNHNSAINKDTASYTEHSHFVKYALVTALIFSKFDFPDTDASFAAYFMASDVSSSALESIHTCMSLPYNG